MALKKGEIVELWNSPTLVNGLVEKTKIAFKKGDTPIEFSVHHASKSRLVREAALVLGVGQDVISSKLSVGQKIFFRRNRNQNTPKV